MKQMLTFHVLGWASLACAIQPNALRPYPAPIRDLQLGELNFLHTTDTHGWHAGHLQEASFGADWGDYIDFSSHMRTKIEADGNDLLIVDTGDRVEGNGLYDASDPQGRYTFPIYAKQHVDIICTGNHELYKSTSAYNDYNIMVPAYRDSYIASNLDIIDPKTGKPVPVAQRFRKFTTKKRGFRVLAFGFLFNFDRPNNNSIVIKVEDAVKTDWFQEAIRDTDLDIIVAIGHVAAKSPEWDTIHRAIRAVNKDIPIQIFAGHEHIRSYRKYDDKSYALASGRYMETIGFQSITGVKSSSPSFFRRYIDNNLYSLQHHSGTNEYNFSSEYGRSVSKLITESRAALKLDENYGCSPTDLWMTRRPYPHPESLYTWLNNSVFPQAVIDPTRKDKSRMVLTNTGAIRFDIFQGPFTRDTTFIISPFTSRLPCIKDVPIALASQLKDILNNRSRILVNEDGSGGFDTKYLAPPEQWGRTSDFIPDTIPETLATHMQAGAGQIPLSLSNDDNDSDDEDNTIPLRPGYTTVTGDDAGPDGDDTIHQPIAFFQQDNVIQSYVSMPGAEDTVDVIFNEFLAPLVVDALNRVGGKYDVKKNVSSYLNDETMTDMIVRWTRAHWPRDC